MINSFSWFSIIAQCLNNLLKVKMRYHLSLHRNGAAFGIVAAHIPFAIGSKLLWSLKLLMTFTMDGAFPITFHIACTFKLRRYNEPCFPDFVTNVPNSPCRYISLQWFQDVDPWYNNDCTECTYPFFPPNSVATSCCWVKSLTPIPPFFLGRIILLHATSLWEFQMKP